jgi:CysZ protein
MKKLSRELAVGLNSYKEAVWFVDRHKLYTWLIAPIVLNIGLLVLSIWAGALFAEYIEGFFESWFQSQYDWLNTTLGWAVAIGVRVITFFAYALFYKNLVLIVMAPLLALLSEEVEKKATQTDYPFDVSQFLKDVIRGVRLAIRNLIRELGFTMVLGIFTFVPVIGLASPVLILLVQSYYFGFSMVDYSCERDKLGVAESVVWARQHWVLMITLGLVFFGTFLIPYVGWIVSPVIGIVAGTLAYMKTKKPE